MSAKDWQDLIKELLADFADEFGSENNPPVYLLKTVTTGGTSPVDPPVVSTEEILLPNAVFNSISQALIDGTLIKQGDMSLVADFETEVVQGDVIKRGDQKFIVITTDPVSPFGISLARKCIVRLK